MRYPIADTASNEDCTLKEARAAIALESRGLDALAAQFDFVALRDHIRKARGRVILSGVGKSAHTARKIAATLASTGTPAQFVHGGDASHGDLGMIAERV